MYFWYAVVDSNYTDWDRGSTRLKEARKMAREIGKDAKIAVIRGGYCHDLYTQDGDGWKDQFGNWV